MINSITKKMLEDNTRTGDDWAADEIADVCLQDKRLENRLKALLVQLAKTPDTPLPHALQRPGELKAAYRFFKNERVKSSPILKGHVSATLARSANQQVVLGVQDTTLIDYTSHPETRGLGPLGNHKTRGIVCHSTLAVTPEGVPLGLLAQKNWVRDEETFGKQTARRKREIKNKESIKWLESVEALKNARMVCPNTTFVSVGDRESDIYDLFTMERPEGVELLVRAAWNRSVVDEHRYLWEAVEAVSPLGAIEITLPRNANHKARKCTLTLRSTQMTIKRPREHKSSIPSISMWVVLAKELNPPPDCQGVEWMLLTTMPTQTIELAMEKLHWYTCRWSIEVWHRILKTGCKIESRQLETVERLMIALTLFSIVAWRIFYATILARAAPDLPCTVILNDIEWQALYCATHRVQTAPKEPPKISQAVLWIAKLGGFLARKGDGNPGAQVLWRGFQCLGHLSDMYALMRGLTYTGNVVPEG